MNTQYKVFIALQAFAITLFALGLSGVLVSSASAILSFDGVFAMSFLWIALVCAIPWWDAEDVPVRDAIFYPVLYVLIVLLITTIVLTTILQ